MTYDVLMGTLNRTHSLKHAINGDRGQRRGEENISSYAN